MAKPLSKKIEKQLRSSSKSMKKTLKALGSNSGPNAATMAGVAVAGAAGIAAAVHYLRKGPKQAATFQVAREGDGWAVKAEGSKDPIATFDTKKEAVKAARDTASASAPSELVIYGSDGTVQTAHNYDPATN